MGRFVFGFPSCIVTPFPRASRHRSFPKPWCAPYYTGRSLKEEGCLYPQRCREYDFSETRLPASCVLGSSETGEQEKRARALPPLPSPSPFPQRVMSRINKQVSVPGVTKCHSVQTLLVIGVTIPLSASCWTRSFSAPAVPSGQQLDAISPGLITPLLVKEGRDFGCPLRN
jgi:hypothetical protein